jgi:hypothetical protein
VTRKWPSEPVREALAVQREVERIWKNHKMLCSRCSSPSLLVQAMCQEGIALNADRADAARVLEVRREQESLEQMGQTAMFEMPGGV